jgi:hypothetical protein
MQDMKVNKYFPFAFLYFFINAVALPFGLTYTALLGPLFYVWVLITRKKEILLPFMTVLAPFIVVQILYVGVVRKVYFYSLINLVLVYIFCQAVYTFLTRCGNVEKIFRRLLIINFIFCVVAIVVYYTPYYQIMWIEQNLTRGIQDFRRLKLFTYEASHYATLIVPLFCFYLLQYLFKQNIIKGWVLMPMIILPLVLSMSFGVIACLIVSGMITYFVYFSRLTRLKRVFNAVLFTAAVVSVGAFVIYLFFRDSFFVLRLANILSGQDSSGKGRAYDAYILAEKIVQMKDSYWGVGLGQIKILGADLIGSYYLYNQDFVATIPNAVAETFAVFGWIGLALRFLAVFFFFFYTRVWTNYYRLWLFLFIFLFQFIGSFITNIAEYVIWILAFTEVFTQFAVPRSNSRLAVLTTHQV